MAPSPSDPHYEDLALLRAQARQEAPPVLPDDLETAIGPAMPLLLECLEAVGQQSMAIAMVGVMREPALFEDREAEIGVLADRIARPAARVLKRRAPDQTHRAVRNDGIGLVVLDHSDIEEPGIFAVHGGMHRGLVAVAMILRGLHHADPRVGECGRGCVASRATPYSRRRSRR